MPVKIAAAAAAAVTGVMNQPVLSLLVTLSLDPTYSLTHQQIYCLQMTCFLLISLIHVLLAFHLHLLQMIQPPVIHLNQVPLRLLIHHAFHPQAGIIFHRCPRSLTLLLSSVHPSHLHLPLLLLYHHLCPQAPLFLLFPPHQPLNQASSLSRH